MNSEVLPDGTIVLGDFSVGGLIGEGGSGLVHKGWQRSAGRPVAIKVLGSQAATPDARRRFLREAQVQLELDHPHLATGLAFGELSDGRPVVVTEFIEGPSVYDLVYGGRHVPAQMTPRRALVIARQMLLGLEHAHWKGLIHRDLKPENVLVIPQGSGVHRYLHVKIIDFGLATGMPGHAASVRYPRLTTAGVSIGTPGYMAPEQLMGAPLDARTDLYCVGTMIFEMLTGQLPFDLSDPERLAEILLTHRAPSLADTRPGPWCTMAAETLVAKALNATPAERFESASTMLNAVESAFWSFDGLGADPPLLIRSVA